MPVTDQDNTELHYKNPPVVETILSVQFDKLPGLTQDPSSRIQVRNKSNDGMLQLQNGRLIVNWLGDSQGAYPRYAAVRERLDTALAQFTAFLAGRGLGEICPNQWEVTYINHIPKGTVWNSPADWAFFRLLGANSNIDGIVQIENFNGDWRFQIPDKRGRLHVNWQIAKKADASELDAEFIRLTLTARGGIDETSGDPVGEGLDLGRATVVRSFHNFMSDEANNYWGYKHG